MSYYAKSKIEHNGQTFEKGAELSGLSEDQAKQLLDSGVVTENKDEIDEVEQEENRGDNVAINMEAEAEDAAKTPGGENEDGASEDSTDEKSEDEAGSSL